MSGVSGSPPGEPDEHPTLPFDPPPTEPAGAHAPNVVVCHPARVIDALADAVSAAKDGDRLAPVTVVVATNIAGVMARRALGRSGGILGVDVVTVGRIAELVAGPSLAAERRRPLSTPVLDVTIADALHEQPGVFGPVAAHPTTVTALREAHAELRLIDRAGLSRLAARGPRTADVVRVSDTVRRRLRRRWYDEGDVLERATELLDDGPPLGLRRLVLHLPPRLDVAAQRFVDRLADLVPTTVVCAVSGDTDADDDALAVARALVAGRPGAHDLDAVEPPDGPAAAPPVRVVTTTDADDEVRIAVRSLVDAAAGRLTGDRVPFERMAVLWPTPLPYARLVEHHLTADGVPWNGRGGTAVSERIAPRLVLDLLDVDRRGLRRSDLFDLLADVPPRSADGRRRPTAEWLRLARLSGLSGGDDWNRLRRFDHTTPWHDTATGLADFVDDLRDRLGPLDEARSWREWTDWCAAQLTDWLGPRAELRLSDQEYRAWEALMSVLDRLRSLDHATEPATRARFRSVLQHELDDVVVREGRIGTGVVVGSLASAPGLDVDVAVVLGGAEGLMPPAPRIDPLLADDDRAAAGLATSTHRTRRLHHGLESVLGSCTTVVTVPRGDLRTTSDQQPSRWLGDRPVEHVASSTAGLSGLRHPPGERERRLRDRLRSGVPARPDLAAGLGDPVLSRAIAMRAARASDSFTEFDGDLTGVDVPALDSAPVSPTQLHTWVSCPHHYFVRHLLGVRPIEEPDRELTIRPLDSGSLQHDVLDRLHRDVIAGRLPQPVTGWTDRHRVALLDHFDAAADRLERRGRTGRPATWSGERARLRAELLTWLDHDGAIAADHRTEILRSEFWFGRSSPPDDGEPLPPVALPLADGRALHFQGSADRVDRWADGTVVVTDHKTGKDHYRQLSAEDPTLGGTEFQLPAYAAAAARLVDHPPTVRAEYSLFARGGWQRRGIEFSDDVWNRVAEALTHVVEGMETGWFPQLPERPGFRLWVACESCDPDGLGTDAAWQRWLLKRNDPRAARWFGDPDDTESEPTP